MKKPGRGLRRAGRVPLVVVRLDRREVPGPVIVVDGADPAVAERRIGQVVQGADEAFQRVIPHGWPPVLQPM